MHKVKRDLLISGVVVLLAVTALVTRGYETISGYFFYAWLAGLFIGVAMFIANVVKLLKHKET